MAYVMMPKRAMSGCGCAARPGMSGLFGVDWTDPTILTIVVTTVLMCIVSATPGVLRLMGKID
jgi:hypothetical protein